MRGKISEAYREKREVVLSVIIPVHNGGKNFNRCLQALAASTRKPDEVIVVDDGSDDTSADIARQYGTRVLEVKDGPCGPAAARNCGVAAANSDILVFIDSDVLIHLKTLEQIEKILTSQSTISAIFGSYDDDPPGAGIITRYKNLQHHYVHHHGKREASTFWAGCGAIRREVFLEVGGFNERYQRPSIEDIELGLRMVHAGYRVWLCPELQVTHLKYWTLSSWLRSDIFDRAVPWSRLIFTTSHLPSDLNLNTKSRVSVFVVWLSVLSIAVSFRFPLARAVAFSGMITLGALNHDLYRFFARKGGILFAGCGIILHTAYYLYSSLTFGILFARYLLARMTSGGSRAMIGDQNSFE